MSQTSNPNDKAFPFTAIVGQDEMKLCLLLNVIDPRIGGVLVMVSAPLDALDGTGINVKYAYGFTVTRENKGVLVFCFEDPDAAIQVLQKNGINVVGGAGSSK